MFRLMSWGSGALRAVRRESTRIVLRRASGGSMDLTSLRRVPASASYPLRRQGLDLVPQLDRTRTAAPVTRLTKLLGLNIWLVTGYHEARAVLADSTSYSNDMRHLLGNRRQDSADGIGGLGMTDPPDHTRLRKLLTPEFTIQRLARLDPLITSIVEETLDELERQGPEVDLVPAFGFTIPFRVICELLGMPEVDRQAFHELGAARFDIRQGGPGSFGAATKSREFLIESVARQRQDPGEGLIGAILRNHGDEFDDVEIGGLCDGVFLGGYETSASMLTMSTYLLARNPATWERLRVGSDQEVAAIVEELLRYLAAVQVSFPRFARADHELFGHRISRGEVVIVSVLAANRDPRLAEDANEFVDREVPLPHLAFGHGVHRCVGAELARMELRAALRGLARRFPDLALAVPEDEVEFRELSLVYGIESLPVLLWPSDVPAGTRPLSGAPERRSVPG